MCLLRQDRLATYLILAASLLIVGLPASATQAKVVEPTITGLVYADTNTNNRHDPFEPGVSNVSVSNGREVVQTDDEGRYLIVARPDEFVFVVKPAGFSLPVDRFNRPVFAASPPLLSRESATLSRADFGLIPQQEPEQFSALLFADPQVRYPGHVQYLAKRMLPELKGRRARFGITLGDIVYDALELFEPVSEAIGKLGIPWFNVIGNHDLDLDATSAAALDDSFERHFGPSHYAFTVGRVHFVVLNSLVFRGVGKSPPFSPRYDEDQLTFLRNNLQFVSPDHLIVVAQHYPLTRFKRRVFDEASQDELFQILARFPHTLSLSGHTHQQTNWRLGADAGWPGPGTHHHFNVGAVSGPIWLGPSDKGGRPLLIMRDGTPAGYAEIRFNGHDYAIDYRVFGQPVDYKMAIYDVQRDQEPRMLYANFFQGTEQAQLRWRFMDESSWRPLSQSLEPDPLAHQSWALATNNGERKRKKTMPLRPYPSFHVWKGAVPSLQRARAIEIEATDLDGRRFLQRATLQAPGGRREEVRQIDAGRRP